MIPLLSALMSAFSNSLSGELGIKKALGCLFSYRFWITTLAVRFINS